MNPLYKMVFWSFVALAGCSGGSCGSRDTPVPGRGEGQVGGRCRSWPARQCDGSGVDCVRGVCRSCGRDGEACCGGAHTCSGMLSCEHRDEGSICRACGHDGQRCCEGSLVARFCSETGAMCDVSLDRCVRASSSGVCAGSTRFVVGYRDSNGCSAGTLAVNADDADDARDCARSMLAGTGFVTVGPDATATEYRYCQTSPFDVSSTVYVTAFSEEDALTCARALCINCEYASGSCP